MPTERGQVKTLTILIALCLTFALGMWLPFRARRAQAEQTLAGLGQSIGEEQKGAVGLAALGHRIVSLSQVVARFDKTVPRQPELASLLRELTDELKEQEAASLDIRPGATVEGDAYCLVPISLRFGGSFRTLFEFLRHVESMDRLVQIHYVSAEGDPKSASGRLTVEIEMSAFYMPVGGDSDG